MTGFLIGLAAGVILAALVMLLISYAKTGGILGFFVSQRYAGYRKVLVATIGRPFDENAISVAARVVAQEGLVQTLYVAEIPLNRPLESGAEQELSAGMEELEESARIAKKLGVRPLPRLERSRLGSKTIVEIQREEAFDAVVLDVRLGNRSGRQGRKVAEYVQKHATCNVIVVSGQQSE
jgi:nucleotide-binding universal stress UspA family protein